MVDIKGSLFAIPIADVECILKVPRREVKNLHGNLVMIYRGEAIPLFDFKGPVNPHDDYLVVVVKKTSNQLAGMTVSSILGEEEIVVKQLPRMLRGIKGISGATILGDGRVGFIMDLATFLQ
ncbi:MAG: hypothetical protein DRJ60_07620 [Thermoprotei archaeon]|nr:MAG: hypothetical protein DRJ60_07620 [Thermoprotei archaeon]